MSVITSQLLERIDADFEHYAKRTTPAVRPPNITRYLLHTLAKVGISEQAQVFDKLLQMMHTHFNKVTSDPSKGRIEPIIALGFDKQTTFALLAAEKTVNISLNYTHALLTLLSVAWNNTPQQELFSGLVNELLASMESEYDLESDSRQTEDSVLEASKRATSELRPNYLQLTMGALQLDLPRSVYAEIRDSLVRCLSLNEW
jgi:hypothetical protein